MALSINRKLLAPKAHYLLYFGGVAAFWPYITVFAKQLGLSESHVGYVFTVAPILGIISMPLFGSIADRYKIKKKLFLVFNVLNLLAILCFVYLTTTEVRVARPVKIKCGEGSSYINFCQKDDVVNNGWNSTAVRANILKELETKDYPIVCQVDCITHQSELSAFCSAVFNADHPKFGWCHSNASGVNAAPTSELSFNTQPNFKTMMIIESCLDIRFSQVKEIGGGIEMDERGMSCIPPTFFKDCRINCPDLPAANTAMETVGNYAYGPDQFQTVFWVYALFTILAWIAMAVVTSVADALCFQTLGDRPDLYGQQRKWGSIGWGLCTLASGFLVDLVSGDSVIKNYTPCFWISGILLVLNFIVCWKWDVQEEERPKALGRRMLVLITEPKIAVFILACVVVGICTGLLWNFLFWYIEDLAKEASGVTIVSGKWIKLLQGLISVVQCFCGELPFFYLAGRFIKKFGHVNSMAIVICTFGVRFLLYSVLKNPWWVLPIELLQGLTYGIFYANMATYAYVVSPEGTAATVQGIVGSAFEGIGVSIGSLLGGLMFHHWSGRLTFRMFGVFSICMGILYKVVMMKLDRKFQTVSQQLENDLNIGTELKEIKKPISLIQN